MAHFGSGVEYGLHCLLLLVGRERAASAADLAAFQGVSPSYLAKLFTRLEKAGLVRAEEGVRGGFRLARPPAEISVLDVVDALEGDKRLFDCREVRLNCVLYRERPPPPAMTRRVCGIHAVMLKAERRMRRTLARSSLADLAEGVAGKLPETLQHRAVEWFDDRAALRGRSGGEVA